MGKVLNAAPACLSTQLRDARIATALGLLDADLSRTIAELANAVNLSPSQFTRLFKKEVGLTPIAYVRQQRLERAALLLLTTVLRVKQIRLEVGAHDPSHFARDFREHFGTSPCNFRRARGFAAPDLANK